MEFDIFRQIVHYNNEKNNLISLAMGHSNNYVISCRGNTKRLYHWVGWNLLWDSLEIDVTDKQLKGANLKLFVISFIIWHSVNF